MSDPVPLREHLEALTAEKLARMQGIHDAHQAVHNEEALARAEAAKRIDARLEALNELRSEVLTDRNRLVSNEVFKAEMNALSIRLNTLHDQITEWKGREKGLSLLASIVIGVVGFVATVLAIYFALN